MIKMRILLGLLLAGLLSSCTTPDEENTSKPNIIFLYVDDLGWKDPGFMGNEYHETPNIDRLAEQGMIFTNAYANAPNCAPSRACLMSGQYTPRHSIYTVGSPARGKSKNRKLIPTENNTILPESYFTLAEALKSAGYITAHFGKWHLGDEATGPLGQGFDYNFGGNHKGHPASYFSPYKNKNLKDGEDGENLTKRLTDEALYFMEKHQEHPFFLYFPFYAVHTPLQAKDSLIKKYQAKLKPNGKHHSTYAAMIETLDYNIGRLLNKVNELKLSDQTIIIFYSDNGNHFSASSALPLRGSKGMLYDGGIRVPLAISWPGKVKAGSRCSTPVIGTDFYPTFAEIAGIELAHDQLIDGKSILPLLDQSGKLEERYLYWHFPAYLEAYGGMEQAWRQRPASAIRQGDWKLIESFEDGKLELYNLKEDIGEQNELSARYPEKRNELHGQLKKWRRETRAPVPNKLNPDFVIKEKK